MQCRHHTLTRPSYPVEIADVFRLHAAQLTGLSPRQLKTVSNITSCRTQALGGHMLSCDNPHCSYTEISYNSCRDRHCPKCRSLAKERWIFDRSQELLPVDYFHIVFTIPKILAPVILQNKSSGYQLLFTCVSQTLQEVAANPVNLGASIGFIAVLHTWDQTLLFHPHIHCIVPGGGISKDASAWTHAPKHFFLPVKALSSVFRGKFLSRLERLFNQNKLSFNGSCSPLASSSNFKRLLVVSCSSNWVVYSKPSFHGPHSVINYLGRYTHRVAISNDRISSLDSGTVSFSYRDRRHGNALKSRSLQAEAFMRRFLLHILPKGFPKIRFFGFLANRVRKHKLSLCLKLLHIPPNQRIKKTCPSSWRELFLLITGRDLSACPACDSGRLFTAQILPPSTAPPTPAYT